MTKDLTQFRVLAAKFSGGTSNSEIKDMVLNIVKFIVSGDACRPLVREKVS